MKKRKLNNFLLSLAVVAIFVNIAVWLLGRIDQKTGIVSALGFGLMFTNLAAAILAGIFFFLRLFRVVDAESNFFYTLVATSNLTIGIAAICLHFLGRINIFGLHELLINLLIGTLLFIDIFFSKILFNKQGHSNPR